jgi:hypothetical protein
VRLVTVVPHTGSWELRAGLLHANVSQTGAPEGEAPRRARGQPAAAALPPGPDAFLVC